MKSFYEMFGSDDFLNKSIEYVLSSIKRDYPDLNDVKLKELLSNVITCTPILDEIRKQIVTLIDNPNFERM